MWVYMYIPMFSVYISYKITGTAALFLDSTLILICTSCSVTTCFKLPHNFMRCIYPYCLFSVSQVSPFVLAVTLLYSSLPGAALQLVMAFSCFPEALCFSCCSMCYPMVLCPRAMPEDCSASSQESFSQPGSVAALPWAGSRSLGRGSVALEGPGGHTALSL